MDTIGIPRVPAVPKNGEHLSITPQDIFTTIAHPDYLPYYNKGLAPGVELQIVTLLDHLTQISEYAKILINPHTVSEKILERCIYPPSVFVREATTESCRMNDLTAILIQDEISETKSGLQRGIAFNLSINPNSHIWLTPDQRERMRTEIDQYHDMDIDIYLRYAKLTYVYTDIENILRDIKESTEFTFNPDILDLTLISLKATSDSHQITHFNQA